MNRAQRKKKIETNAIRAIQREMVEDINNMPQLPVFFEAYTPDTSMDHIVKHYTEKHGTEPKVFYHLKCGSTNMIVAEVKDDNHRINL